MVTIHAKVSTFGEKIAVKTARRNTLQIFSIFEPVTRCQNLNLSGGRKMYGNHQETRRMFDLGDKRAKISIISVITCLQRTSRIEWTGGNKTD